MTKAELIDAICALLKESNTRKPVAVPKQTFTITDDEGHSRMFTVKRKDREALYTQADVRNIINAMIRIIVDQMQHGGQVYIPRIGTFAVQYREASKVRIPGSRQWKDIPAHYVPKMNFSEAMREAAKIYEAYIVENAPPEVPIQKRGRGRPRNSERILALAGEFSPTVSEERGEEIVDETVETAADLEIEPEYEVAVNTADDAVIVYGDVYEDEDDEMGVSVYGT